MGTWQILNKKTEADPHRTLTRITAEPLQRPARSAECQAPFCIVSSQVRAAVTAEEGGLACTSQGLGFRVLGFWV